MGPSFADDNKADEEEELESDGVCNLCGERERDKEIPQIWSGAKIRDIKYIQPPWKLTLFAPGITLFDRWNNWNGWRGPMGTVEHEHIPNSMDD